MESLNKLKEEVILRHNVPEEILSEVLSYAKFHKGKKETGSTINGKLAIKFHRSDNTLLASSSKWGNIVFNLKNFIVKLSTNVASTSSILASGVNYQNVILSVLAAIGIWDALVSSKKIELKESHAELLLSLGYIAYSGQPLEQHTLASIKLKFDIKGWNLESTLKDLSYLKIISYTANPFHLHLKERIVLDNI